MIVPCVIILLRHLIPQRYQFVADGVHMVSPDWSRLRQQKNVMNGIGGYDVMNGIGDVTIVALTVSTLDGKNFANVMT